MVGDTGSIAKGKKGSVILLIERNDEGGIINFRATMIDGEQFKEDVFYRLKNGEFAEVNEDEDS